jgi:hypothetical protein
VPGSEGRIFFDSAPNFVIVMGSFFEAAHHSLWGVVHSLAANRVVLVGQAGQVLHDLDAVTGEAGRQFSNLAIAHWQRDRWLAMSIRSAIAGLALSAACPAQNTPPAKRHGRACRASAAGRRHRAPVRPAQLVQPARPQRGR